MPLRCLYCSGVSNPLAAPRLVPPANVCPDSVVTPAEQRAYMPRQRPADGPPVVHRTARIVLRLTCAQGRRCFDLLRAGGDVAAA